MYLTKKKKEKISKSLSVLGSATWDKKDVNISKAICEICVTCDLNVDNVFEDISKNTSKQDLFIDVLDKDDTPKEAKTSKKKTTTSKKVKSK